MKNSSAFYLEREENKEAATVVVLLKKVLLNILQNSQENTCIGVSFHFSLRPATLLKKKYTDTGFWEIFKKTFFREYLRATVSETKCYSSFLFSETLYSF